MEAVVVVKDLEVVVKDLGLVVKDLVVKDLEVMARVTAAGVRDLVGAREVRGKVEGVTVRAGVVGMEEDWVAEMVEGLVVVTVGAKVGEMVVVMVEKG